ncbi:EPIDERMAL PATTERNING FACTOR-like protein 8 [Diospyros lotus]|uniref:EPIDERMAL PATTERNING FACTOR-like protein 8 n=1 Tax=Diospyros lotus TaxID=55363 RepID=UPI002255E944|nr:EPIDERMAL PATTERNING FACTOR-like protein 8 [Diospyros lotus]
MALSLPHGLKLAVGAVILMSSLIMVFLPSNSKSDALGLRLYRSAASSRNYGKQTMKMVVGSKPPECVDKCMSCRPCMAALVPIPPSPYTEGIKDPSSHGEEEEDRYYLLSWKCRCGDKLYQP